MRNKTIYLVLGVLPDGTPDVFGAVDREYGMGRVLEKMFCDFKTRDL